MTNGELTHPIFQVGEVARLLSVQTSLVRKWIERGHMQAKGGGRGPGRGRTRLVSSLEVDVARHVLLLKRRYAVQATPETFRRLRDAALSGATLDGSAILSDIPPSICP